jgi:hypothetical protein
MKNWFIHIAHAGLGDGLSEIGSTLPNQDLRDSAGAALLEIITYMGLAAVIAIVVAGIYLIVGAGSDSSIQRARKIVIATIVGLALIYFASAIVSMIDSALS